MQNPHATTHQNGGSDEVSVAGLSGLLADDQNPVAHAGDHENGGGDEISVAGLSGLLADAQNPVAHAGDHENGGGDEISVLGLSGLLADGQTPLAHAASHASGQPDQLDHNGLLNVAAGDVHTQYAALAGRAGDRLVMADDANVPPFQMTERAAGPAAPAAGDVYLDDGTNFDGGGGNPGFMRWTGAAWEDLCSTGGAATWTENDTIYVDPGGNDGNSGQDPANPLLTIAQAITNATALTPAVSNQVVIRLSPGVWTESITTADDYVHFVGAGKYATKITNAGQTFRIDNSNVLIRDLTIEQTSTSYAAFAVSAQTNVEFHGCYIHGTWVNGVALAYIANASEWTFYDCKLEQDTSAKQSVDLRGAGGSITMYSCDVKGYVWQQRGTMMFYDTRVEDHGRSTNGIINVGSNVGKSYFVGCYVYSTNSRGIDINIGSEWACLGCIFEVGSGDYSVGASSSAHEGVIQGCAMLDKGYGPNVGLLGGRYRFATSGHDYIENLLSFIQARQSGHYTIIDLEDDYTFTSGPAPDPGTYVFNGNGHTLTFSFWGYIGASTMQYNNCRFAGTYPLSLNNAASRLGLYQCYFDGGAYVDIASVVWTTQKLVMVECTGQADPGNPMVKCAETDTEILIERCNLKGSTGQGALDFTVANTKCWIFDSVLLNGTSGGDPVVSSAVMTFYADGCRSHVALDNDAQTTQGLATATNDVDALYANVPDSSVL